MNNFTMLIMHMLRQLKNSEMLLAEKMIWPQTGVEPGWDYDFVQAVFTTSIGAYGKNWTNFWEKAEDMPELEALAALGGSCTNERSFTIVPVKN